MSLRLERVSHRFGNQDVLKDVSLSVERGDCYGFIGHNGAGKTTAMRVMLGLLQPDQGRVVVDGFEANEYPREARVRMGALIEQAGFHANWSGAKNLRLLDRLAGGDSDIDSLLEQVGLGHAGDKPVRAYSQGMRQRLGVAQALLGDPDYVLLDEPSNGLDPDGIQEMRQLIRRITREKGHTVFISSHQLHELAGVCNRVGVLRRGQLVMEDSIENLLRGDAYRLDTDDEAGATKIVDALGIPIESREPLSVRIADREPAQLVKALVEGGVPVRSFAPQPPSLEEIYHREAEPVPAPPAVDVGPPEERRAPGFAALRMIAHEARRWTGQWTLPLMLATPAVAGVLAMLIRKGESAEDIRNVGGGTLATASAVNAFEGVARALHPGVWLLGYIVLGLASQSVAGEYGQGTLRNVMLRPITRVQIALGKAAALLLGTACTYLLLVLVAIGTASWAFEWKGVTEILPNGQVMTILEAEKIRPIFWRALWVSSLPLFAYAGIGFLLGSVTRRGATAIATSIGLGVGLEFARGFFVNSAAEPWLPMTYLPSQLGRASTYMDHLVEWSQARSGSLYLFEATDVYAPLAWVFGTVFVAAWVLKRRYVP